MKKILDWFIVPLAVLMVMFFGLALFATAISLLKGQGDGFFFGVLLTLVTGALATALVKRVITLYKKKP